MRKFPLTYLIHCIALQLLFIVILISSIFQLIFFPLCSSMMHSHYVEYRDFNPDCHSHWKGLYYTCRAFLSCCWWFYLEHIQVDLVQALFRTRSRPGTGRLIVWQDDDVGRWSSSVMVSLTSWIEQEKTKCPVEMLMVMLGYVMWQRQEVCLAFPRYYTGHCMLFGGFHYI